MASYGWTCRPTGVRPGRRRLWRAGHTRIRTGPGRGCCGRPRCHYLPLPGRHPGKAAGTGVVPEDNSSNWRSAAGRWIGPTTRNPSPQPQSGTCAACCPIHGTVSTSSTPLLPPHLLPHLPLSLLLWRTINHDGRYLHIIMVFAELSFFFVLIAVIVHCSLYDTTCQGCAGMYFIRLNDTVALHEEFWGRCNWVHTCVS